MQSALATSCTPERPEIDFYRQALAILKDSETPFLVGGAYALAIYTGISRDTKDLDLFVRPRDCEKALRALAAAGYPTELTFSHWLAKVYNKGHYIDIIFNSGNGLCEVDDDWFEHAVEETAFDVPILLCPVEEVLWQKAFIMERERFDGADVVHLLHTHGDRLNWPRLLKRFEPHWQLLLAHLVLYSYVYPTDARRIPLRVMHELSRRLRAETSRPVAGKRLCRGPLLSRGQFLVDIESWSYEDPRLSPRGNLSSSELAAWTAPAREYGTVFAE